MQLYSEHKNYKLYEGNMLDMLEYITPNSVDSIVTDPPYELNFMGKGWDNSGIAFQKTTWEKCFEVLKPGGYLLAFGGTRTFYRIACAIEDAGFEIRDTIMWLYGCLSEDTEVLTQQGFKQFHKITDDDKIRIYDIKSGVYKWEIPQRWNVYKTEQDSCYRIKSDSTDQLVSRNHRCLVEREGKLVFEFAENLRSMERVPVLSYDIPYLQEGGRNILLTDLLWQDERLVEELFCQQFRQEKSEERSCGRSKFCVERWSNLSEPERELYQSANKICSVSEQVYNDGEKRRICNGTPTTCSPADRQTFITDGSSTSQEPQCRGQQNREPNAICNEQRSQDVRGWKTYTTTLATVTKESYSGIIFCPTVSTGCFVARRNGKVFITGNSGFPKSMNIGLAIDKKNGVESEVVGSGKSGSTAKAFNLNEQQRDAGTGISGEYEIKKAQNEWNGWGTALKPAYEPIIVARKPCEGSCIDNVIKYGVGGINIDECRVGDETISYYPTDLTQAHSNNFGTGAYMPKDTSQDPISHIGRYPSNVLLTYDETDQDEVIGGMPYTENNTKSHLAKNSNNNVNFNASKSVNIIGYQDSGSAARYFYCAKASNRDRDEGLDDFETTQDPSKGNGLGRVCEFCGAPQLHPELCHCEVKSWVLPPKKNIHPTVKPCELMQYLVRLVTPKGGTILDPFNGSGSTGKAVMYENKDRDSKYKYIGIELTHEYLPISDARISYVANMLRQYKLF